MTSIKDKDLDTVLNNLFGAQPNANPNGGWKEVDITDMFGGMIPGTPHQPLMTKVPMKTPLQPQFPTPGGQPAIVYLKEGYKSYRKLEIDSPVPVAIEVGPLHGTIGKEFEYVGNIKVYITENISKPVDLSKIDHSKFINLVIVRAPWVGSMLVPESAILKNTPAERTLLKG